MDFAAKGLAVPIILMQVTLAFGAARAPGSRRTTESEFPLCFNDVSKAGGANATRAVEVLNHPGQNVLFLNM
jgi:hypothetical protein